ncbi:MAG TPA: energy transducer TonB [Pyrinomonadaceae bacterium]
MKSTFTVLKYFCLNIAILFAATAYVHGQDRAPTVLSQPEFKLSDAAMAVGVDGVLGVSLKIDKSGRVKDVVIHGGPAWPCGSSKPGEQIEAVREAVKKQLLATTFEPPMKNGKSTDVELSLQFAIGQAYKAAVREDDAKNGVRAETKLIEAGVIEGRAVRLVKPVDTGVYGIVVVRVLVDEKGNVAHAGAINRHPRLQESVRTAACESKFSPTVLSGKPVKVTGIITYNLRRS